MTWSCLAASSSTTAEPTPELAPVTITVAASIGGPCTSLSPLLARWGLRSFVHNSEMKVAEDRDAATAVTRRRQSSHPIITRRLRGRTVGGIDQEVTEGVVFSAGATPLRFPNSSEPLVPCAPHNPFRNRCISEQQLVIFCSSCYSALRPFQRRASDGRLPTRVAWSFQRGVPLAVPPHLAAHALQSRPGDPQSFLTTALMAPECSPRSVSYNDCQILSLQVLLALPALHAVPNNSQNN